MTTARMIEYRITQQLLQRREIESRRTPAGWFIKKFALLAGLLLLSVSLPELLLLTFIASLVLTLGIR